jgi:hypothetical protein
MSIEIIYRFSFVAVVVEEAEKKNDEQEGVRSGQQENSHNLNRAGFGWQRRQLAHF